MSYHLLESPRFALHTQCLHPYIQLADYSHQPHQKILPVIFFFCNPRHSRFAYRSQIPPLLGVSLSLDLYLKALSFNTGVSFQRHCGGFTSTSHRPKSSSFYGLSRWCRSESDWGPPQASGRVRGWKLGAGADPRHGDSD
jgi:hypothetical protein